MDSKLESRWFSFSQNNSGGSFHHEPLDGIGRFVFIEAQNAAHAKDRAERIGLYFNGCASGLDCSCCGDRWSDYVDDSDGEAVPMRYGETYREAVDGEAPELDWGIPSYIHRIGGEFHAAVKVGP